MQTKRPLKQTPTDFVEQLQRVRLVAFPVLTWILPGDLVEAADAQLFVADAKARHGQVEIAGGAAERAHCGAVGDWRKGGAFEKG